MNHILKNLNSYKIILFLIIVMFLFITSVVKSATPADSGDSFGITAPQPNQKISGTIALNWQMTDDTQTSIPYTINLLDAATCLNITYATLAQGNGTRGANSFNWNTLTTQASLSLKDGLYCVRICASMEDNSNQKYSICDARKFMVVNFNSLPKINSNPTNTTIYEGQTFTYQIAASDSDNDTLVYRLVKAPNFMKINQSTGLITTNPAPELGANILRADYQIIIEVDDKISGTVRQQFTLTVLNNSPAPTPVPPPSNGGTNPPPPQVEDSPTNIDIILPKENDLLKGKDNKIQWKVTDNDGVKLIKISYSSDRNNWTEILSTKKTEDTFTWDVSKIAANTYFLQFEVEDNKGSKVKEVSEQFTIDNNNAITSNPQILNVVPAVDSTVTSVLAITGDFLPSQKHKIDPESFIITLDGNNITDNCQVDESGFDCDVQGENLPQGLHEVTASVKDTSNQEAKLSWSFKLESQPSSYPSSDSFTIFGREFSRGSLIIGLVICCLGLLLLLIPWIIYTMWRNRQSSSSTVTETEYFAPQNSYVYPTPTTPYDTTVTTNYYNPEPITVDTTTSTADQPYFEPESVDK